jgi:hypothetical protein
MVGLLTLFGIAFIAGFLFVWLMPMDDDTPFLVFASQEELDQMCWSGLRNPKE